MKDIVVTQTCKWNEAEDGVIFVASDYGANMSLLGDMLVFVAIIKRELLEKGECYEFYFDVADVENFVAKYPLKSSEEEVVQFVANMANSDSFMVEYLI